MHISIIAFIFCLSLSALFGCFFAWTYHYRKFYRDPSGRPQRITESMDIPFEIAALEEQERIAVKRAEQEKTSYETDSSNKDAFIKKLLNLFYSKMEKERSEILSLCYWAFSDEGFVLRLAITPYRLRENLTVPKNDRYFSKKEFTWDGQDEIPVDIFQSDSQIAQSLIGTAISGDGKLRGYITMDSAMENAFDDSNLVALRELAVLAEETLQILDLNTKFDQENNIINAMLKDVSSLFNSVSKSNLVANLSKVLQDNFKFDRLMIITLDKKDKSKWYISDALGEQHEYFKGASFSVYEKSLLYEILAGQTTVINEMRIPTDPYQRRLFEDEPRNLNLRSLFAVRPHSLHNSYPMVILLESRNKRAVSRIDIQMLTCLAACSAVKLSDIMEKIYSRQKKEIDLIDIDSNGLGETLHFYEAEMDSLKHGNECLGILLLKCKPLNRDNRVLDFNEVRASNYEKFAHVLKTLKKNWNGRHLAMLGSGEFIFSIKGNFSEKIFDEITASQIIANAKNMLAEDDLDVDNHNIWLDKNKMEEKEQELGYSCETLFKLTIMSMFRDMSEV